MKQRQDWPSINAYVDGELSREQAADMAEAIAEDDELARQVAVISSLKAAVARSTPRYGSLSLASARQVPRRYVAFAMLILAIGAALLAGTGGWWAHFVGPDRGVTLALETHEQWRARIDGERETGALPVDSSLERMRLNAYIPDLSQVELRFSDLREISAAEGSGLHVGYLGSRGCTVSLVLFPTESSAASPPTRIRHANHTLHTWQTGGVYFYMVASGMDPERLARTAEIVHRLTVERLPLGPAAVLALETARSAGQPCMG